MKSSIAVSFTFLVITIFTAVATASDVFNIFRCPNNASSNCFCSPFWNVFFLIGCADSTENILILISFDRYTVLCYENTPLSAYQELPFGNKSNVKTIDFEHCPFPDTSFGNLISNISITDVKELEFRGSNIVNETLTNQFEGMEDVTRLNLHHNKLTHLPDNIFSNMKSLTWLSLAHNSIQQNTNFLKSLTSVITLNLQYNQIRKLTNIMFSNMSSLKVLDISNNNINEIMSRAFNGLNELTVIDLSYNNITTLHLESVNNSHISPYGLFANNKKLKTIHLNNNKAPLATFPDLFLSNLDRMEEVYLTNNKLKRVPENMFSNSTNIKIITLNKNMLEQIPSKLFSHQRRLETLDLSSNLIKSLSNEVFYNLANLKTLILNHNSIEHLQSDFLYSLRNLDKFSINHNKIYTIAYNALCNSGSKLTEIDMSHNLIEMPTYLPLYDCFKLRYVNLSHNKITEIWEDWEGLLYHFKQIRGKVRKYSLTEIQDESFADHFTMDLTYNKITTLGFMKHDGEFDDSRVPKILVENNPVICDCKLHEFINYFGNKRKSHVWDGINDLKCADPSDLREILIKDLKLDQLVCRISEYCPENCECYIRHCDKCMASIVKCSNITVVPALLNNLKGTNHTELHLEDNQITSFSQLDLYTKNRNITKLYLQNNRITDLKLTENIEVLNLNNNQLKYVSDTATVALNDSRLRDLYLSNNSLACDCDNREFLLFLQVRNHKIKHFNLLACSDGQKISTLKLHLLCSPTPWPVVVSVLLALAGMAVGLSAAALFYKYKQKIKIYLFAKGWLLSWVTEEELDKDKLYDAFISFSHKDEDFVINELVSALENGPEPHSLCIHFRDWIAGELIPTQIRRSVEDSRRTIVVLSPNFLESVWGQLEFREAYSHALKEGRARVIIILYCNIDELKELDPELKAYMDNNTYVKWGDPWFWKKLRYALPHRTFLEKNISDRFIESKK